MIKNKSKNLFDGITANVEIGNVMSSTPVGSTYLQTQVSGDTRLRVIELIPINPNTQYTVSVSSNYDVGYLLFDTNKLYTGNFAFWSNSFTITTSSTERYIALLFRFDTNATITPSEITSINAQLELGSTATAYIPYNDIQVAVGQFEQAVLTDRFLSVHNPASNDIPIPALNNKTLNEVFVGGQLLSNGDFSNGTTDWTAVNGSGSVSENVYTFIPTTSRFPRITQSITTVLNNRYYTNSFIKFSDFTKVETSPNSRLETSIIISENTSLPTNNNFNFYSAITQSTNANNTLRTNHGLVSSHTMGSIQYKNMLAIDMTDLGIASQTQAQMDAYFEAWQRNNAGTLLANTFIQHDQNSVPIADLNGKTLDEVFIGGNLVVREFELGNVNSTLNTRLRLKNTIPMVNTNNYYIKANTFPVNEVRVAFIADEQTTYNYTTPFLLDTNWQTTPYTNIYTAPQNGSFTFIFSYTDGRVMTLNDVSPNWELFAINLTALGITATQAQLDFWYSVWQQNHKLGMRVHRASGNDIPLAVLNNQSLNQVFNSNLITNGDFENGTTGWSLQSAWTIANGVAIYDATSNQRITQNISGTNSDVYINFDVTNSTNAQIFIALGNVTSGSYSLFANKNNGLILNNATFTDVRIFGNSNGSTFNIDNIKVINLTSLGIATLTKSQLDYLFTVWQFNQVNALVARQFIQEA